MEPHSPNQALAPVRRRVVINSGSRTMEINIKHADTNAVVEVSGDVDMSNSPRLREALLEIVREGRGSLVVVSLEHVEYVDSSGIASLVEGLQEARKRKVTFRLAGLNDGPRHVLELTRLIDVFDVYSSQAEALQA